MLRLLIDENFNQRILRGLLQRVSQLDYLVVQQAGMSGLGDPALLESAASDRRILITHDVNTIPNYATERVKQGLSMPGVIIVPDSLPIGRALEDLEIILECAWPTELVNRIQFLPL